MSKPSPGQVVRKRREQLGISREKLAVSCDISVSTVSRLELSDRMPSVRIIASIAGVLGVTIDDLLNDQLAS